MEEYKEVENMESNETGSREKKRKKGQYEEREGGGKEEEIKPKSLRKEG